MSENNKTLNIAMLKYDAFVKSENEDLRRYNEFLERISSFKNVKNLKEAKKLAQRILPTANSINRFHVGKSICIVINTQECFRISVDTPSEYICYNFE